MKIIILIEGRALSIPTKEMEQYTQLIELLKRFNIPRQVILTKQLRIAKNFIDSLDIK